MALAVGCAQTDTGGFTDAAPNDTGTTQSDVAVDVRNTTDVVMDVASHPDGSDSGTATDVAMDTPHDTGTVVDVVHDTGTVPTDTGSTTDTGPRMCPASCTSDTQCQTMCPNPSSGMWCCQTGFCNTQTGSVCSATPPDSGTTPTDSGFPGLCTSDGQCPGACCFIFSGSTGVCGAVCSGVCLPPGSC
jgi:hypothetical protein